MAVQLRPISFGSYAEMAGHLDRWAARTLTTPEAWEAALIGSHAWLEFAPRNQVLLLSYGIDGPVAGAETWRFVPSADGRGFGVRAGEHGFPVRVPITTGGREPDPFVGGTRPTKGSAIPLIALLLPVALSSAESSLIGEAPHSPSTSALPTTVTTPVPAMSTFGQAAEAPEPNASSGTGVELVTVGTAWVSPRREAFSV